MTGFIKNASISVSGNAIAQFISIATIPLITRVYTPSDYGVFTAAMSVVLILTPVMSLRSNMVIVLPTVYKNAVAVFLLSHAVLVLCFLVILSGFILIADTSLIPEHWQFEGHTTALLYILPVILLVTGLSQITYFWAIRKKQFKAIALARVSETTIDRAGALCAGALFTPNVAFLLLSRCAGAVTVWLSLFFRTVKGDMATIAEAASIKRSAVQAKRYLSLALFSSFSQLTDAAGRHLPLLIMALYFSSQHIGYFALAFQIVNMPMVLLGESIAMVFMRHCVDKRDQLKTLKIYIIRLVLITIAVCAPVAAVLLLYGEKIFSVIFDTHWSEAGVLAAILFLAIPFMFIHKVAGVLFEVLELVKYKLIFDIALMFTKIVTVIFLSNMEYQISTVAFSIVLANAILYSAAIVFIYLKLVNKNSSSENCAPVLSSQSLSKRYFG